ncbi:MAG: c-type cytochrome [Acidobacteriota bacterium]|nr:c-type cytochrome [Acidobacteriota bacterium]
MSSQTPPSPARTLATGLLFAASLALGACDIIRHQSEGEKLYRKNCADCHGIDGAGNTVQGMGNPWADLIDNSWKNGGDDASLASSINDGAFGQMPAFKDKLTPEQVRAIIYHLRVLRGEKLPAREP